MPKSDILSLLNGGITKQKFIKFIKNDPCGRSTDCEHVKLFFIEIV